jgi:hypothetical protein
MTTTFKARVRNGKLEPLEPTRYDEDTLVGLTAKIPSAEDPLEDKWDRLMTEAALPEAERKRPFSELLDEVARSPETSRGREWVLSEEDRMIYASEGFR